MKSNNLAIITCIDSNFIDNLKNDFLRSLVEAANFDGHIYIMEFGINEEIKREIQKSYNVIFVSYTGKNMIFIDRYKYIVELIDTMPKNITHIMYIDGGDVWFQKDISPIFKYCKHNIGCVEESIMFDSNQWCKDCIANLPKPYIEKVNGYLKNQYVKNSGLVCGPRNSISLLCKKIYNDIKDCGVDFFGVDQIFFNYEINKAEDTIVKLDKEYNYVLVTIADGFIFKSNKIYNSENKLVTIVHNAGGNYRVLNRTFSGKLSLYSLTNVKKVQ